MIDNTLMERRLALLTRHFFNRTDIVAALVPRGRRGESYPMPVRPLDGIEPAVKAHLLGKEGPNARYAFTTRRASGSTMGRFRLGSYAPAADKTTRWLCLDFDGPGHAEALADPGDAVIRTQEAFAARKLPTYIERSGGGAGFHLWMFLESGTPARHVRGIAHVLIPGDLPCESGELADPQKGRGIEVFPKSQELCERRPFGNMVWLPWWAGATAPANLFHRLTPERTLVPYEPEHFEFLTRDAIAETVRTLRAEGLFEAKAQARKSSKRHLGAELAYQAQAYITRDDDRDKLESALAVLDPDCGYQDWLRIGMALQEWDPLRGFTLWDQWSRRGRKYKPGETDAKWHTFRRDPNGITLGTVFQMAKDHGWVMPVPRDDVPQQDKPETDTPGAGIGVSI